MSRLASSTSLYNSVTLTSVRRETPAVTTLCFLRPFDFVAGEYITVMFDDLAPIPPKAYSISCPPGKPEAAITVRDIGGPYSSRLCSLGVGDSLKVSYPYGYFNPKTTKPLVVIAAGVGISPAWSIVQDELERDDGRQIDMYVTNKTVEEIVFRSELDRVARQYAGVNVQYFVTREPVAQPMRDVRIECESLDFPQEAHFLVCGSESFVRDMYMQLRQLEIAENRISTETFFMSKVSVYGNAS